MEPNVPLFGQAGSISQGFERRKDGDGEGRQAMELSSQRQRIVPTGGKISFKLDLEGRQPKKASQPGVNKTARQPEEPAAPASCIEEDRLAQLARSCLEETRKLSLSSRFSFRGDQQVAQRADTQGIPDTPIWRAPPNGQSAEETERQQWDKGQRHEQSQAEQSCNSTRSPSKHREETRPSNEKQRALESAGEDHARTDGSRQRRAVSLESPRKERSRSREVDRPVPEGVKQNEHAGHGSTLRSTGPPAKKRALARHMTDQLSGKTAHGAFVGIEKGAYERPTARPLEMVNVNFPKCLQYEVLLRLCLVYR